MSEPNHNPTVAATVASANPAVTVTDGAVSFRKFIPLVKVDESKREVGGIVTQQSPDKDGETCHYKSTVPFYKAWSEELSKASDGKNLGNLREMHGLRAAGAGKSMVFDDTNRAIFMTFKVVDDDAWKKCTEGVYTGFSQGGEYINKWRGDDGQLYYTAKPSEVSLVDNPCLPTAHFEFVRADGKTEMRKFKAGEKAGTDTMSTEELLDRLATLVQKGMDAAKTVSAPAEVAKGVKYLVTDSDGKGHLPYTDDSGKISHRLMGAAWAALHGGYRGNKYEGPDKDAAITRLKHLYSQEGMDTPAEKRAAVDTAVHTIIEKKATDLGMQKGMYEVGMFANALCDLAWIRVSAEWERERERDGSSLPEDLQQDLESLAETFLLMAREETEELVTSADEAGKGGTYLMTAKSTAELAKAAQTVAGIAHKIHKAAQEHCDDMKAAHMEHCNKMHKAHADHMGEVQGHVASIHKILGVEEANNMGDGEPKPANVGKSAEPSASEEFVYEFVGKTSDGVEVFKRTKKEPVAPAAAAATVTVVADVKKNRYADMTDADIDADLDKRVSSAIDEIVKALAPEVEAEGQRKQVEKGIGDRTQIPVVLQNAGPTVRVMPVTKAEDGGGNADPNAQPAATEKIDMSKVQRGDREEQLKFMRSAKPSEVPATVVGSLTRLKR